MLVSELLKLLCDTKINLNTKIHITEDDMQSFTVMIQATSVKYLILKRGPQSTIRDIINLLGADKIIGSTKILFDTKRETKSFAAYSEFVTIKAL